MKLDPQTLTAYLDALKVEFDEGGDPNALMRAVSECLREGCVVPDWAAEAFLRALSRWHGGSAATLDEALGFNLATPKRTRARRLARLQALEVLNAVRRDDLAHPNEPLDAKKFARVGADCGLSAGTAKRRYYEAMRDTQLTRTAPSARVLDAALLGPYIVSDSQDKPKRRPKRAAR